MESLNSHDQFHLRAALGWAELENPAEAREELSQVRAACRLQPEVLNVRWSVLMLAREWPASLAVAETQVELYPDQVSGWINRSYSLHEMDRTQEALNQLLPVARKFEEVSTVPYNLACYACRLGQNDVSLKWLVRALAVGDKKAVKKRALEDPDLKELHPLIRKL